MAVPSKYEKRVIKVATWGFVSQEIAYHAYEMEGALTCTKGFELALRAHVSRQVEEETELDLTAMVNHIGKTSLKFARALIERAKQKTPIVLDEALLEATLADPATPKLFPFT